MRGKSTVLAGGSLDLLKEASGPLPLLVLGAPLPNAPCQQNGEVRVPRRTILAKQESTRVTDCVVAGLGSVPAKRDTWPESLSFGPCT